MNGQVHYNMKDTTVNMTAQVSCVDGFEIKGDDFVICQPDGTWSNATCIESLYIVFVSVKYRFMLFI